MSRELGRYELLRPIARGGMAEVYLARRRAAGLEKLLVVKRIRAERAGDARFLELFVREARLSMSLAHQNIVPVFDFGRVGEQVFLAMERVEGKDLGSTLGRPGVSPLPAVVAAFVAAECCQALDYAHHRRRDDGEHLGVVHRDVTPRNVLVSWSGEVKLTDFGVAALAGEQTSQLAGTPAYMAPEQARGEPVDARADVYAVGLVLREALTGERARPGEDRGALIEAARRGALSPWPAGHDAALVAIVDRATAVDPAHRFSDARSMLAALDAFIVGERAARPGEAPARRLATWLAAAWEGARDPGEPSGWVQPPFDGAAMLSFLDDGGGIGTGTERSFAATAADAGGSPSESPEPARSAPAPAPSPDPPQVRAPEPAGRPARVRWFAALGALGVAGALAIGLVLALGRDRSPRRDPEPVVAAAPVDAARAETVDLPRVQVAVLRPPELSAPETTPAKPPARSRARRDSAVPRTGDPAPRAGDPAPRPAPAPPQGLRKVRVNARPWATFTVDGGSTSYETIATIQLAPGTHRLVFSNPQLKVERAVTIDVPADRDLDHVEDLRR
ncbi:MAG: serine/threonine-protein kinase [Kofleriaceae bacterium]